MTNVMKWITGLAAGQMLAVCGQGEWTAQQPNPDPARPYIEKLQVGTGALASELKLAGTIPTNLTGVAKVQGSADLVNWTTLQATGVLNNQWGGGKLTYESNTLAGELAKPAVVLRTLVKEVNPTPVLTTEGNPITIVIGALAPISASPDASILEFGEGAPPVCSLVLVFKDTAKSGTLRVGMKRTVNNEEVTRNYEFPGVKPGQAIYNLDLAPAFYLPVTNFVYMEITYQR